MRLFVKANRYVSEVAPRARIAWLTNIGDNDEVLDRILIVRTPIRQYRKYTNPWSFQHEWGWCTYTFSIRIGNRLKWHSMWEPYDPLE